VTKINKLVVSSIAAICSLTVLACSSGIKKADIASSADPQTEITKFESDITTGILKNVDVLAASDFKKSVKLLDEAKVDLAKKEKQATVLDDVRNGRGYLDKAYSTAGDRATKAPGLFEARQAALGAGAASQGELRKELKSVDSDVSGKADKLDKMTPEELGKLQARYSALEIRAVVLTQLGGAQSIIIGVRNDGTAKKAPQTFKNAELSFNNAESVISANARNPQGYQAAVGQANTDATLLKDVMTTISQNGKNLSEPAALKMVAQNRQINHLKSDLTVSAAEGAAAETDLQKKNQVLALALAEKDDDMAAQNEALVSANNKVEIQKVIEKARGQFSSDEAEAYQQGGNLLIRLKQVNFASGRSDLPAGSLPVLAKVSEIAKLLNASGIKVEGHTDSIGNEITNKTISEKRASAVATYFKANGFKDIDVQSEGYGFEKPIATNKSKAGRAQNRRVDILITPKLASATE
jgi:OmpA-OmpF porin, OOP family